MENIETYQLNNSDFILYKKDGKIKNGGFSLESFLKSQKGGGKEYVVPSGLYHSQTLSRAHNPKDHDYKDVTHENKEIPDDLYDKLLDSASLYDEKKEKEKEKSKDLLHFQKTRKERKSKTKSTSRKQKREKNKE